MKRLFILACLLVVLGVLLVDPFGGRREPVDTSSPVLPSNAGEALLGDPDPIPDSGPPPETREAVEVDSAPAADETSVEEGIHVSGTIVVLDEEGIEHPKESGSFTPISWHGEFGAHGAPVDVQEGRFELRMPSGKQFGLKNLRLGDRFARLKEYGPIEVSDGSHLELLAAWAPPIVLHVVDSASRRDLEGIELVRHSRRRYLNKLHPGDYDEADVVRRGATSPLELPTEEAGFDQPRGQVVLWVRAPSYAWGRIKVGYTDPVGHTLELSPAGSLEVTLVGELPTEWIGGVPAPPPVLRLREEPDIDRRVRAALRQQERSGSSGRRKTEWEITREIEDQLHSEPPSGEPLIELSPAAEGPTVVEGVRPGIYVLTVEVGDWVERSRYMLGRESVVLEAGRRAGVNVMLELPPWPNARVPLAGTLHRPPAWENSSIALIIEPLDFPDVGGDDRLTIHTRKMQSLDQRAGLYSWSAGEVLPGRYRARIHPFHSEQVFDVPSTGLTYAHIEVGEPAEVVVHVVEKETRKALPANRVLWKCLPPGEPTAGFRNDANPRPRIGPGTYVFLAPAGRVEILVWDHRYRSEQSDFELYPGMNEIELIAERNCGIVVIVRDGASTMGFRDVLQHVHVREVGGDAGSTGWWRGNDGISCVLPHPGRYEVSFDGLGAFKEVAPAVVEVPAAEFVEHVIEVVRIQ